MEWIKYNMNNQCRMKLTPAGRETFIVFRENVQSEKEAIEEYESRLDEDGCISMQLWVAFQVFGPDICWGHNAIHADEFYLDAEMLGKKNEKTDDVEFEERSSVVPQATCTHKFVAIYIDYDISYLECLNCGKAKPY